MIDAATIARMTPEDKHRLRILLEQKHTNKMTDSFWAFFQEAWKVIEPGTELKPSKHLRYLCDTIEGHIKALARGEAPEFDKIVVNIPPSTSKSSVFTKILPAWAWIQMPHMRIITSSYDDGLVTDHTVKTRDILTSEWYRQRWGHLFNLKSDQNEKKRYYNDAGGIRKAATTKGAKTGFHCHLYIEDDPIEIGRAHV